MIIYPTETIYALGVNAFSEAELEKLYTIKNRDKRKPVSILVRNLSDLENYAELSDVSRSIAQQFLPGPLSLVLVAKPTVPNFLKANDGTLSFRLSSDPFAQKLIVDFMQKYNAPLTCTSANLSGKPTESTPQLILEQLGAKATLIERVIDDGPRSGKASTVISVINKEIKILREGTISAEKIFDTFS